MAGIVCDATQDPKSEDANGPNLTSEALIYGTTRPWHNSAYGTTRRSLAVALAAGLCQSFTMAKKEAIGNVVDLKKRLADTTAKAAKLKAATHQMEDAMR